MTPSYKMIIPCIQQAENKTEVRTEVMALESVDEVTIEFNWEPSQAITGEKS